MGEPEPKQARSIRIAVQVLVALIVFAGVVAFVHFRNYVETSPRFCQSCHAVSPEIAMWTESEHRTVRCQQCHHQTLEDGMRILKAYVAGRNPDERGSRHAPVDVSSCAACHSSHDARWPSIADSVGHRVHVERAQLECTRCHGRQMHLYRPARSTCAECHQAEATSMAGAKHEQSHCLACHNFLSPSEVIKPTRRDCLRCHESEGRRIEVQETSPMQFACYACHRPHQAGMVGCTECHPARDLPALHTIAGHNDCRTCHAPHNWIAERKQCFACHEDLQTHYADQRCSSCHRFERALRTGP